MDLTLILAGIIVFGVGAYVILDGFDLGVGILFPLIPDDAMRDTAINSIAPVWDGNETWLILGGAVLFAAFPVVYAVALSAFYIPIMLLLFALIFRGVAFEFRFKATRSKNWWSRAFTGGSTLAAFAQGLLLGGILEGVTTGPGPQGSGIALEFAGASFDWLTPFSVITGLGVVGGYALLGATWLNMKTEDGLRDWSRAAARKALYVSLLALAVVSLYTPLKFDYIAERWFADMHWLSLSPVPLATAVVAFSLYRELKAGSHYPPFFYAIALFLFGYLGIGISLWPHILPPALTVHNAAAPEQSQVFVLVALSITLPMVLIYTVYAYWVFRGKVEAGAGYTH
ncbi:cytochrome d ubiquinol oxidase subunit II [Sinimarinibacterium flocculans]|uniref:Cytochrome bd-I ubiquinol oxidase subunit 2 apoprotein n=1 Tax=Sinimarinibacterium flocculans TaxID=985250 RepID=A0A318EK22_9GAMM|nr:cytochrome d ubiquinol oxidase subunit II [Sinimarinibacterium flocculans]PXV71242.1 cytochrome bd-I ubiquinol oxidase subunit 2 apoprotein [Sinimarinibacterium flocculans]